ncbi:MAG: FtsW/RodA/SpoVE family cell cycle protein [Demequinaceae bacterium]|nr:FtsW/RodA/SpoVE family cell cycle protein [Demequinaceae bacterium]
MLVGVGATGGLPPNVYVLGLGTVVAATGAHLALRRWASAADPVILPVTLALNGLGLAMIYRLDLAHADTASPTSFAPRQLAWTVISMSVAIAIVALLRDHRLMRRFTYTAMAVGLGLLLLPLVPGLGVERRGAHLWIDVAGLSLQPAELAKIALAVFFAGYLVANRHSLALAGPRVLGLRFPRARDLGPLLLAWIASLAVLVYQRDLGTSLLFFGLFLAMVYVATARLSWVLLGCGLFVAGAIVAGMVFSHVADRYDIWLHALDPEVYARSPGGSEQLVRGLFGLASGGLFGTGLGEGMPSQVPFAESDFIVSSLGEELGLVGLSAILCLYVILVQRALRTSLGLRDGFGKLLAAGLGFSMALQVFVVVGGVTRVIPLTGLTTPFLAYGGSSLLSNWVIIALLIRISDGARRVEVFDR